MTITSSPIDAKTMSHSLQLMNNNQDAARACLDVVPDPTETPLHHVAYLHAADTLIPSLHRHYTHGAHDEEGERVPEWEMQYRSAARVDDGQLTGAVNLFFLTSLRTIAAWANQYPEEAEDAEFDAKGRLAGCETEQLFISRSRAENIRAVRKVFNKRMDPPKGPTRRKPALHRFPPPRTGRRTGRPEPRPGPEAASRPPGPSLFSPRCTTGTSHPTCTFTFYSRPFKLPLFSISPKRYHLLISSFDHMMPAQLRCWRPITLFPTNPSFRSRR